MRAEAIEASPSDLLPSFVGFSTVPAAVIPQSNVIACIDPKMVRQVWPHVSHLIRSAVEKTALNNFRAVEEWVLRGKMLLWVVWNGDRVEAAATTLIEGDTCVIVTCGGSVRRRWLHHIKQIENYADQSGCRRTRIYGRKGWMKALPDYRDRFVILEKEM